MHTYVYMNICIYIYTCTTIVIGILSPTHESFPEISPALACPKIWKIQVCLGPASRATAGRILSAALDQVLRGGASTERVAAWG